MKKIKQAVRMALSIRESGYGGINHWYFYSQL